MWNFCNSDTKYVVIGYQNMFENCIELWFLVCKRISLMRNNNGIMNSWKDLLLYWGKWIPEKKNNNNNNKR